LSAVKQNAYAIKYIENPSKEVQLAAKKDEIYIMYFNNHFINYKENKRVIIFELYNYVYKACYRKSCIN
jgi:N-acetylneuraminic acid mutarotase